VLALKDVHTAADGTRKVVILIPLSMIHLASARLPKNGGSVFKYQTCCQGLLVSRQIIELGHYFLGS
jgi:hypothetical protein